MRNILTNMIIIAGIVGAAGLSGCAAITETARLDAESERLAAGSLVVGKFELVRNGEEVPLGDGLFSNTVRMSLIGPGGDKEITVKAGDGGDFAWPLARGEYEISHVAFDFHGERLQAPTNLAFSVSDNVRASYIGSITLEVTLGSGYGGTFGSFDRFRVRNDCATDCDRLFTRAGISSEDTETALVHWRQRVAFRR